MALTPNRVTPADVRCIFDTELTDEQLECFITTAHILIDSVFLDGEGNFVCTGMTEDIMTQIEKYAAASFATSNSSQAVEAKAGTLMTRLQRLNPRSRTAELMKALLMNEWGLIALTLDPCGLLKERGEKRGQILSFSW